MSRALVFDLDGTLADTLADVAGAMNRSLARAGLPGHAPGAYRFLIGDGVVELARRALPPGSALRLDEIVAGFREIYAEHLLDETKPYPGIPELLAELRARKVPSAVLSNKPEDATRAIVDRLFPAHSFATVAGQRPDRPRKPDPTVALAIARDLGVPPAETLLVGDSKTDMLTATAVGMVPIGVLWGFRDRAELEAHGARAVIERPSELLEWLDS